MSDLNAHSRGEHELNLLTSPSLSVRRRPESLRVGTGPRERFMHVTCCVSLVFISLRMNPDFLQVSPPLAHPNFIFFHPRLYVPPTVNSRTFLVCTGRLIASVLWVCAWEIWQETAKGLVVASFCAGRVTVCSHGLAINTYTTCKPLSLLRGSTKSAAHSDVNGQV
jgi:hypothetical protein